MKRKLLWGIPAVVYLVFTFWYTDLAGPVSDAEVDRFVAAFAASGTAPEQIATFRRFLEEDTGSQFIMVNLLDMAANPGPVAGVDGVETADQLMNRYMEHMWPALLRRACHPVFAGGAVHQAMDLAGIDGAEHWTRAALMRYRSRRDIAEIATNPAFAGPHHFKMASLNKTIAFPVEAQIYLSDLRVLLLLVLIAAVALTDVIVYGRRP
ncbi:MAG: hypothetical protein HC809_09680 [Gammaproteobacteria bacterium]|nr:hypothetical protein [Gammaproteobacteria bacterium]